MSFAFIGTWAAFIAFVAGLALAGLAIIAMTSILTPSAQQSDSSLIVYGDAG